jgi:hypothetical protein
MASMGLSDPAQLTPHMLVRRVDHSTVKSYAELYRWLAPGELLGEPPPGWDADWQLADPDSFAVPR